MRPDGAKGDQARRIRLQADGQRRRGLKIRLRQVIGWQKPPRGRPLRNEHRLPADRVAQRVARVAQGGDRRRAAVEQQRQRNDAVGRMGQLGQQQTRRGADGEGREQQGRERDGIEQTAQNEYEILLNGVAYTFSVETPFSLKRKKILASRQSDLATIIIKSPMPGKILDVQVDNGQEINKGDTLLILEAMKMQNIITATHRGRISRLCVKTGQIVGKDEILAEIKL